MDESVIEHLERTTREMDEASKLLLKAAQLIEDGGLARGLLRDGSSFCVVGAITYVAFGKTLPLFDRRAWGCPAIQKLRHAIGGGDSQMVVWNNGSRADEVISTLRRVALGG